MPAERTTERLKRILVLVPWVIAHPEATVSEVCERFGITRDELASDVDVLMMCGLPPFGPGDLIEAFESDEHRWVVGVQWHPERIGKDQGMSPEVEGVFDAFVQEAARTTTAPR